MNTNFIFLGRVSEALVASLSILTPPRQMDGYEYMFLFNSDFTYISFPFSDVSSCIGCCGSFIHAYSIFWVPVTCVIRSIGEDSMFMICAVICAH